MCLCTHLYRYNSSLTRPVYMTHITMCQYVCYNTGQRHKTITNTYYNTIIIIAPGRVVDLEEGLWVPWNPHFIVYDNILDR